MPNRYICSVLEEMRDLDKTRNFSPLLGLIAEAQILVNRMEAKLNDYRDYKYTREEHKRLEREVDKLRREKKEIK